MTAYVLNIRVYELANIRTLTSKRKYILTYKNALVNKGLVSKLSTVNLQKFI